ncbi:hypothetical protein Tco_1019555 [Tanacetum coccineum]|uniref:Monodehydroascorbate reductase n=1 Tax=Tanacetum coccineum TaxID=301880 RepID=A0ABQ5FXJ8_9ASTR
MNTTKEQQKELDDAFVVPETKEPTIQVVLDALKLTPFYNAFEISADVPKIYMQEFWVTVTRHHLSLRFKLDGKSHTVKVDNFRDMLKICPKLPGQKYEEPPLEEDILSFIKDLGHNGEIKFLSNVNVNHMHQPWRSFDTIINKCLSGKTTALESLCLSLAQILWGMYNNKKVDYVYLQWEDLVFQVENKNSKKNSDIYYPRFTKVIIDYFMAKDQAIPRRNKMFWHYARDDFMFTTIRVISKHKDTQEYGPKSKATKKKTDSESSPKIKPSQASKGKRIKTSAKGDKPAKTKSKGLTVLSEVALSEAEQMKLATKRSMKEFHISHASGLGNGVDILSKVPDEQQQTRSGRKEGAGDKPEVPDVPEYRSESEEESCTFSQGEDEEEDKEHDNDDDNNDNDDEDDDQEHDSQRTESDDSGDDFVHMNLSTYKEDEEEDKKAEDDDEDDDIMGGEQEDEEDEELSFVSSDLVAKFINLSPDTGIDSLLNQNVAFSVTPSSDTTIPQPPIPIIQPQKQTHVSTTTITIPTTTLPEIPNFASLFGFDRRVSSLEIELSELKQTNQFAEAVASIPGIVENYLISKMKDKVNVALQLKSDKLREEAQAENQDFLNSLDSNMKRIIKEQVKAKTSKIMTKVEKYVTETLGAEVLVRSTNQPQTSYAVASSLLELELKKILMDKMEENKYVDRSDVQKNLYRALLEAYNSDKDLLSSYGEVVTLKRGRDDQHKDKEPSAGSNRGSKRRRSSNEESSRETTQKVSKSTSSSKGSRTPDREWNQTKTVDDRPPQQWMTKFAQASGTTSPFNEFLATPIDFSAFMMNRLNIQNLTQDLLTSPTHDLIKGTCKSVVNKPLPLIPDARGRQIIPYDHFINNDLEYLKGGSSSRKYTTSITKTKAADYDHNKWIEDKIPRSTWSEIMEFFGYTHLEEITVQRQDYKLYKFQEGDFKRLCHEDIEDMLLLLIQGKLTNINVDEWFALNVALRMYTRRIVIQECVEDLQLAVESYQKKVNLTKPDTYRSDISKKTPYTAYRDIQGIIFQDDMDRNRLMHTDELHKFSDGTLNHFCTSLNDIATGIQMEYLPMIKWSKQDK